jgi:molybdopterin-binding protein
MPHGCDGRHHSRATWGTVKKVIAKGKVRYRSRICWFSASAFAAVTLREQTDPGPAVAQSARNRMIGIVTHVLRDTVMAQVELQCGPFRVVSLMSREAADQLGLEPGVLAVASIKSTNVVVELPASR